MVENSVKPSSKEDTLASSRPMAARNLRGVGDLADDLSRFNDAEVASYLNTTKESLLMKIAWELMNPEYKNGTQRKPTTTVKKKDPISKTTAAPSKKTSATTTQSNAESEKKKRLSPYINLDVLDKLFEDDENSPKRTKLEEPVVVGDKMENFQESREDEPVLNENYSNEDANGGYGDADLEYEDQDEDNEDIIW
ncbi:uncharacterized protein LOC103834127 isoform X2 [Brassica rapa]|uniref:uncharacterized protein LOC103834127 isoform X2 n=1 Tax=Brassica campestris TaxID=3711 RepID=UPI00142DBE97|nr:uncharacterized protein LOC103834127 isoform X2 [Brassica rapa]